MTLPKLQTVLRLLIGESETRTMRLNVGQPVPPFTVGCEGSWVVQGPGVASRHLSFAFDGRELKVAAAAFRGTATINGTAIDERWWPVPYPAEIRFGEGLLLVSCEAPAAQTVGLDVAPVAQSAPSEQKQTALDGAGAWREMQAACAAAIKGADAAGPPAVPAASSDFGKLHVSDAPWPIAPARQVALEAPASAERDALIEGPKGVWRSLSPVKKVTFVLLPFALFGALWPDLPDWVARLRGAPTAPPRRRLSSRASRVLRRHRHLRPPPTRPPCRSPRGPESRRPAARAERARRGIRRTLRERGRSLRRARRKSPRPTRLPRRRAHPSPEGRQRPLTRRFGSTSSENGRPFCNRCGLVAQFGRSRRLATSGLVRQLVVLHVNEVRRPCKLSRR